ncbi:DUF2059 domain-containing protein [Roseovarius sp. SCSIO 43702]|uniref:DUF2059 domain-containing protein n=1 Tax=Roseovarius sp. SCSIO 43702 TaxID=2823043 RepID=UPI001C738E4A|nr:DUF2059 domain-containing protein [Roseovarius sp. SCSIO 43702]QYX55479.1 DUF2059 domain-containing protein [Roseovarius sp. SCSIO 43702]
MRALLITGVVLWTALQAVAVEAQDRIAALSDALRLGETVEIMREEAIANGHDLSLGYLGDPASKTWIAELERINAPERMIALLREELAARLEGEDVEAMIAFFDRPEGQRIIELELAARRVMGDPVAEEAARAAYYEARADGAPILEVIDRMTEDSDLLERNVAGALNSNLMFLRGMADGGGYEGDLSDMTRDVWAQEDELREELADWLGTFQLLAYQPLDPDVLDGYAEFFRSDEGRALNDALFLAFNRMIDETSYLTGRALARHVGAEQL